MGRLEVECPAMDYIRNLEGSQPEGQAEVPVSSYGGLVRLWGTLVGWRAGKGCWKALCRRCHLGRTQRQRVPPVVSRKVPQGVNPQVLSVASLSGVPLPPRAFTRSQEVNLLGALKEGRSFAQVAGSSVPLDHVYSRFGAQNFRAPRHNNRRVRARFPGCRWSGAT